MRIEANNNLPFRADNSAAQSASPRAALPSSQRSGRHIAWIGPKSGECSWLIHRANSFARAINCQIEWSYYELDETSRLSASHWQSLLLELNATCDRVIVVNENRNDLSWSVMQAANQIERIVPYGVVTSHWITGSRRSGSGLPMHWQHAWYRWWDAWFGWLFPESARPQSLASNLYAPLSIPVDLACVASTQPQPPAPLVDSSDRSCVVIACADAATAATWQMMASCVQWQSRWIRELPCDMQSGYLDECTNHCLLLDDSICRCLPNGCLEGDQLIETVQRARSLYPNGPIVIGLDLLHVDLCRTLHACGVDDWLIKPSYGLPLSEFLASRMKLACRHNNM